MFFLFIDIDCVFEQSFNLNSYVDDITIENFAFLNYSRKNKCKKEIIKKRNQIRIKKSKNAKLAKIVNFAKVKIKIKYAFSECLYTIFDT